jgi:ribonuclease HII
MNRASIQALTDENLFESTQWMWNFEQELAGSATSFAGVDEAGRGALAGPVVAAAVILGGEPQQWQGIDDSKKLSKKKRSVLHDDIMSRALGVGVGIASAEEIDALNILHASRLAMGRAVRAMGTTVQLLLVDGTYQPVFVGPPIPSITVVSGDAKCLSVAAASIIAKVVRDTMMQALALEFPQYGFAQHVGYGTKQHLESLDQHGPTRLHRTSFSPVRQRTQVR